jgi:hypothetical protein
MQRTLSLKDRSEFLKYLDSVSKISDSAIFNINNKGISCLVASADNTLILYSQYNIETDIAATINVPDIKKLYRVIDTIDSKEVDLVINSNNIEYRGDNIKFKYHLYEEGFLSNPSINIEKIKSFVFDVKFTLGKNAITQLLRGSTFASETNKVYFYTEDDKLKAELTDRSRHNTDNFAITIGDVDFNLSPIPINFDNIRLISSISSDYKFGINTDYGVIIIDNNNSNIKLKYIISSLTQ